MIICGERGIRTLGTGKPPYAGLANRCLQPLGHLSKRRDRLARKLPAKHAFFVSRSVRFDLPHLAEAPNHGSRGRLGVTVGTWALRPHVPTLITCVTLFDCQRAEEEGFEPPELALGGFQDRCLRPLGHSS